MDLLQIEGYSYSLLTEEWELRYFNVMRIVSNESESETRRKIFETKIATTFRNSDLKIVTEREINKDIYKDKISDRDRKDWKRNHKKKVSACKYYVEQKNSLPCQMDLKIILSNYFLTE